MHQGFKDFLLEDAKKWSPETRTGIAQMLKKNPQQLKANIMDKLIDWGTVYCIQSGDVVISEVPLDADELMDAWGELLKAEMSELA